jgi:hypothetical protein
MKGIAGADGRFVPAQARERHVDQCVLSLDDASTAMKIIASNHRHRRAGIGASRRWRDRFSVE